jgi:hypothetical protein
MDYVRGPEKFPTPSAGGRAIRFSADGQMRQKIKLRTTEFFVDGFWQN